MRATSYVGGVLEPFFAASSIAQAIVALSSISVSIAPTARRVSSSRCPRMAMMMAAIWSSLILKLPLGCFLKLQSNSRPARGGQE